MMKCLRRGAMVALMIWALLMSAIVLPPTVHAEVDPNALPDSITISPEVDTISQYMTHSFTAKAHYANGTTTDVTSSASWFSNNLTILTVVDKGQIKAVAPSGSTTIRAMYQGVSGTATVSAGPPVIDHIDVLPIAASIQERDHVTLTAQATYVNGPTEDITGKATWTTSAPSIATVSRGVVTGVQYGTAQITATYDGWANSSTITVLTVVKALNVSPSSVTVPNGTSAGLWATAEWTDGHVEDVSCEVTWISSNAGVTVDGCGNVTAHVSSGTATITVKYLTFTKYATVYAAPPKRTGIKVSPRTVTVPQGKTQQFTAVFTYTDFSEGPITVPITWSSSNQAVATIDSTGNATALASSGSTTITAKADGFTGTATLTAEPPVIESLAFAPPTANIPKGTTLDVMVLANMSNKTLQDVTQLCTMYWGDSKILQQVGPNKVKGVSEGTTEIKCTITPLSATMGITVGPAIPKALAIDLVTLTLPYTQNVQLKAIATFTDETTRDVTQEATWTNSAPDIIAVDHGKVTALKDSGSATITAGYSGFSATSTVTAKPLLVVEPASLTLSTGLSQTLKALWKHADGTTTDATGVTWKSANPATASVDATGKVTAVARGTTTISATTEGQTATAQVTVTPPAMEGLPVTPAAAQLAPQDTLQLTATGSFTDKHTEDLTQKVTWSSDHPEVATVSATGLVTAIAQGTATITAALDNITGSAVITVSIPSALSFTPAQLSLPKGTTGQVTVTATYPGGTTSDVTANAAWTSSNAQVATVAAGTVTAVGIGTTDLTATVDGVSAKLTVAVTPPVVKLLTLTPSSTTVPKGMVQALVATAIYTDGSQSDVTMSAAWASSNAGIATVSAGQVTGVAIGSAVITANYSGFTATAVVTVGPPLPVHLTITSASPSLLPGESLQLAATMRYSDGMTADVTSTCLWQSSNPFVAVTSTGRITAMGSGSATITATCNGMTASIIVNVATLTKVTVAPASMTLDQGRSGSLTATATWSNGRTTDLTGTAVWSSSNQAVATVNTSGTVTAVNAGSATITATYFGKSGSATVTVVEPPRPVSLSVMPVNPTLAPGAGLQLTAMANYSDGSSTNVTSQAGWSSSAPAVATVTSGGYVTGVAIGSATINATYGGFSASQTVTVADLGSSFSSAIELNPPSPASGTVASQQAVYYVLRVTAGSSWSITLTGSGNPDLYVYNSAHTLVLQSTLGAGSTDKVTLNAAYAGVYYIKVVGNAPGSYTLSATLTSSGGTIPPIDPPPGPVDM